MSLRLASDVVGIGSSQRFVPGRQPGPGAERDDFAAGRGHDHDAVGHRRARHRHQRGLFARSLVLPGLLAIDGVEGGDLVGDGDHENLAVGHGRSGTHRRVELLAPHFIAARGIERHHLAKGGGDVDVVAVGSETAAKRALRVPALGRQRPPPHPAAIGGVEGADIRLGIEHIDAPAHHDRARQQPVAPRRSRTRRHRENLLQLHAEIEIVHGVGRHPAGLRPIGIADGRRNGDRIGRRLLGFPLVERRGVLQHALAGAGEDLVLLAGDRLEQLFGRTGASGKSHRQGDHDQRASVHGVPHGLALSSGCSTAAMICARCRMPCGAAGSVAISLTRWKAS